MKASSRIGPQANLMPASVLRVLLCQVRFSRPACMEPSPNRGVSVTTSSVLAGHERPWVHARSLLERQEGQAQAALGLSVCMRTTVRQACSAAQRTGLHSVWSLAKRAVIDRQRATILEQPDRSMEW